MKKLPKGSFFFTSEEIKEKSEKLLCAALRHNLNHAAAGGIPLLFALHFSLFSAALAVYPNSPVMSSTPSPFCKAMVMP